MRRHVVITGTLWLILTFLGELWVLGTEFNPPGYAREARTIDGAFQTLMVMGIPVFAFVIAVLAYSILRFRTRGDPTEDGPPIRGNVILTASWLAVTSALAVLVIINPGLTGMAELRHEQPADLVVKVEGGRWYWRVQYPQYNVDTRKELVLPVDKRVRFEVTATDVVHSFWVPAFRVKIDAVPGLVTTTHATPNRLGSFEQDDGVRLQCAELCGVGHNLMRTPVRVVTQAEFDAWVAQQRASR
ncbi:MAG: cytochrome c oxidase subunit II [Chloroflexi bacterium]|nr:cytochrome c oxidase subunit II [Chloroflexota bacterium]